MDDNTNLTTHIRTDPNAWKHSVIGGAVFVATAFVCVSMMQWGLALIVGFLMSLCAGISIEIVQRIQGGKNTTMESVMDALTTTLWFLYPIVKKR